MSFETKIIDVSGGPVDLMVDTDVVTELGFSAPELGAKIFVQNTSTRSKIYYAEQAAAPDRTDKGHCLMPGDGFLLRLRTGIPEGAWIWGATTGTVAVSPALDD